MKLINVSNEFTLLLNHDFLASKNITLVSTGPKLQQSVEIQIVSKSMDSRDILTCVVQIIIVALLSLAILCIMKYYNSSKSLDEPQTQDEVFDPAELAAEGEQQPSDEEDDIGSSEVDSFLGEESDQLVPKQKGTQDGEQEDATSA